MACWPLPPRGPCPSRSRAAGPCNPAQARLCCAGTHCSAISSGMARRRLFSSPCFCSQSEARWGRAFGRGDRVGALLLSPSHALPRPPLLPLHASSAPADTRLLAAVGGAD
eukprot:2199797-Heterocapsa_arctica.AAC.1